MKFTPEMFNCLHWECDPPTCTTRVGQAMFAQAAFDKWLAEQPVVYFMQTEGSPFMHKTGDWPGDTHQARLVAIEEIKK